jgi:hypothetical protein
MRTRFAAFPVVALLAVSLHGAVYPGPQPTWLVSGHSTWNEALAAVIARGGSNDIIAVPTGNSEVPYVVLWRWTPDSRASASFPADPRMAMNSYSVPDQALAGWKEKEKAGAKMVVAPSGDWLLFWVRPCGSDPVEERPCAGKDAGGAVSH